MSSVVLYLTLHRLGQSAFVRQCVLSYFVEQFIQNLGRNCGVFDQWFDDFAFHSVVIFGHRETDAKVTNFLTDFD